MINFFIDLKNIIFCSPQSWNISSWFRKKKFFHLFWKLFFRASIFQSTESGIHCSKFTQNFHALKILTFFFHFISTIFLILLCFMFFILKFMHHVSLNFHSPSHKIKFILSSPVLASFFHIQKSKIFFCLKIIKFIFHLLSFFLSFFASDRLWSQVRYDLVTSWRRTLYNHKTETDEIYSTILFGENFLSPHYTHWKLRMLLSKQAAQKKLQKMNEQQQ